MDAVNFVSREWVNYLQDAAGAVDVIGHSTVFLTSATVLKLDSS